LVLSRVSSGKSFAKAATAIAASAKCFAGLAKHFTGSEQSRSRPVKTITSGANAFTGSATWFSAPAKRFTSPEKAFAKAVKLFTDVTRHLTGPTPTFSRVAPHWLAYVQVLLGSGSSNAKGQTWRAELPRRRVLLEASVFDPCHHFFRLPGLQSKPFKQHFGLFTHAGTQPTTRRSRPQSAENHR